MKYPDVKPGLKEEVPWSDSLTSYDRQHFTTYLRLLDAGADEASYEEMAQVILGIDPVQEPERARKTDAFGPQSVRCRPRPAGW
ncbi:DUF2285 domain-containing protein [Mesorhizobium sp. M0960]|uniref:hypothetical protein n=1 Tax=Mesorhizobium sp. M0960 TaxID=2957035 RepID=UPI003338DDDD